MIQQNIGSLPKSHLINGLVLHSLMTTLDGVYMNDIVKVCKVHGDLTESEVRIRNPNNISCKACARERVRAHRKENKELLNFKSREFRKKNIDHIRLRDREWKAKDYINNKEKYAERSKRFYKNNIDQRRNYRLKKLYGITLEQYNKMLSEQNNKCKICNNFETAFSKQSNKIKDLSVDHCHNTGIVRGLLCSKCNCLIGYSLESIELLQEAINYLKEFYHDKSRE
jgi:hypothetical protein